MCIPISAGGVRRKRLGCVGELRAVALIPRGCPQRASQSLGLEARRSQVP